MNRKIYLVRHARSEANEDRRLYHSQPDAEIKLHKIGIEQSLQLGKTLYDLGLNGVDFITSPYERTIQTAKNAIQTCIDSNIVIDNLIYEQIVASNFSDMANIDYYGSAEDYEKFPKFFFKARGMESLADVYTRARIFYQDVLFGKYKDKEKIVVISHGIFLLCLQAVIQNIPAYDIDPDKHLRNVQVLELDVK